MKNLFIMLTSVMLCLNAQAQLPKWIIPPVNDTIYVKMDERLLQCDAGGKSSLWTMNGTKLYSTDNTIMPFRDGVATIVKKGAGMITGFVDTTGRFTALPNLPVAFGSPYFENGFLPYLTADGYGFYGKDGMKAYYPQAVKAFPFHHGYSPYFTFDQMEKKKDPHYAYRKADGKELQYRISTEGGVRTVDPKNIQFLSGIGADGRGVAAIKDKLYWFIPETETFEPFLWGDGDSEKKRHLRLTGDYERYLLNLPADTVLILAKYGKDDRACLKFDKENLPVVFTFHDRELRFKEQAPEPFSYRAELTSYGPGPYGLSRETREMLPAQFEQTGLMYDNKALVKTDGKWGLIEIIPDSEFSLKLNKNEDIAFRHQKFETQIRLDLPPEISAKYARIDIPESTGCVIDKTSRETKDTESGNFVTYDCVLSIPEALPDTITTITYSPVRVSYDGIDLFEVPISVKAWHFKSYNVDPIESETSISNGLASFTININAQRNVGENDYPFEVRIEADSVGVEYEKLSETRYKCLVSNLQEGVNNLNILVTEKGCPSSVFPFEIYYTRPVPKRKQKEEVVVRKKSPRVPRPAPRIEL